MYRIYIVRWHDFFFFFVLKAEASLLLLMIKEDDIPTQLISSYIYSNELLPESDEAKCQQDKWM